jgi:hypothetical protein
MRRAKIAGRGRGNLPTLRWTRRTSKAGAHFPSHPTDDIDPVEVGDEASPSTSGKATRR